MIDLRAGRLPQSISEMLDRELQELSALSITVETKRLHKCALFFRHLWGKRFFFIQTRRIITSVDLVSAAAVWPALRFISRADSCRDGRRDLLLAD